MLLKAATDRGHTSAAQQLVLAAPHEALGYVYGSGPHEIIAHTWAMDGDSALVQALLSVARDDAAESRCDHWFRDDDDPDSAWTLLHSAALSGSTEAMQALLQLDPALASSATYFDRTPLHIAAAGDHTAAVQLLLQAAPETAAAMDYNQQVPLHYAAESGSSAVAAA